MKGPVLRADKNVIIVAIVLSAAGHAVAQSPTADDPILYVQILRAGSHSAQTWWPYNDADEWDPNIVPMVPLNALSYPHASSAPAAAQAVHAYFAYAESWFLANQLDPTEFRDRFALQFFNFGGDPASAQNPALQSPTEFWAGGSNGDTPIAGYFDLLNVPPNAANFHPWMPQRSAAAKAWMDQFLQAWNTLVS